MRAALAAVLLLLAGGPVAAATDCAQAWAALTGPLVGGGSLSGRAEAEAQGGGQGCLIRDAVLDFPGQSGVDVDIAAIRFDPASAAFLITPAAGGSLDMVLTGIRFRSGGNADAGWLMAAQAQAEGPASALISLNWQAETRRLRPINVAFTMPGVIQLDLLAEVANVDLSTPEAAEASAGGFAVTRLGLVLDSAGQIEAGLLPQLARQARPGDPPDRALGNLLAEARAWVPGLPPAAVPAQSRAALTGWLAALPRASGRLTLTATAENGFGPARLALMALRGVPQGPGDLAPLLAGVQLEIGWQPGRRF